MSGRISIKMLSGLIDTTALPSTLTLEDCVLFLQIVSRLKREILHSQRPEWVEDDPPPATLLPDSVVQFLSYCLCWTKDQICAGWNIFGAAVWKTDDHEGIGLAPHSEIMDLFKRHGRTLNFAYYNLYPPQTKCSNGICPNYQQGLLRRKDNPRKVNVHMLHGSYIAYSIHLICHRCSTNYHHNFSVSSGFRTYYGGVPDIIQVSEHQFIHKSVLNLFVGMMLLAWTSATNAARIYNQFLSNTVDNTDYGDDAFVATVTTGLNGNMEQPLLLRKEYVWDGFILLALLEDYDLQERFLLVPHTGGQNHRFDEAMSDRNHFMSKSGQPEWNHFCDKCCRVWNGENGEQPKKLRVIVTDGITIGHPSCCIPHCPNPLDNNQDHFCQDHSAQNEICAIIGCTNRVDAGYKTCNLEYHRGMEEKRNMSHKGFFQLRDRLARQKVSHPNNAFQAAATDDVVEEHLLADTELDPVCQEKGPDGKHRIQAQFGRHRHIMNKF